jgi:hypothetical protein
LFQLQKEYAAFGYFTRMGDNLVAVFSLFKVEQYKDDIESYAKTRALSVEELFVIDSYERLDKDKLAKESFTKQEGGASEVEKKIVYKNFKIQFNELKNWEKLNPKFPNMIFLENPKNRSKIVIRAFDSGKTFNTNLEEERANRWLANLTIHFGWDKTETKTDGNTVIDGEESYWR